MTTRNSFHNNGNKNNNNGINNINKGKPPAEEFPEKASNEDQQPKQIRKKQLKQEQEMESGETHALLRNGPLSHSSPQVGVRDYWSDL